VSGKPNVTSENKPEMAGLRAASEFMKRYWLSVSGISLAVLVPCFWHRHIEACDLGSHVYNAWLAELIEKGQAPGLVLVRLWNNVLFDFTLVGLGKLMSLAAAERLATAAAVLIFFWGAFALVCAIRLGFADSHTVPWFLFPGLAALAYGYSFEMGFMNYYISIGLAFWALALLVRSSRKPKRSLTWEHWLVAMLLPLIWMAHPLGFFLLVGAGAYVVLASRLRTAHQFYLFCAAALFLAAVHFFIKFRHWAFIWRNEPRLLQDGADQLRLWGDRYALPAHLLEAFFLVGLLADITMRIRLPRWWERYMVPLQLYGLAVLGTYLLPSFIGVPRHFAETGVFGFLTERLTSISAIFACCLLGTIKPRTWHYVVLGISSGLFFLFLYQNTGTMNRMENQADALVRTLPAGERVLNYVSDVAQLPGGRITNEHLVERACIGRCFIYNDYEPLTGQFRIRVRSENGTEMRTQPMYDQSRKGKYVVAERDLPLAEIYQCVPGGTDLCMCELVAGQENGRVNHVPVSNNHHVRLSNSCRVGLLGMRPIARG
jgi:hypothetical protein